MRRALLPLFVLVAGVAIAAALIATRPQAARAPADRPLPAVEVVRADPGAHQPTVRAMGRVKPVRELLLQPEIGGRVLYRSPNLVPGGRVEAGEVLVRVDTRDHKTSLEAQRAALAAAQMQLEEERARRRVAEKEWQGQAGRLDNDARRIALRETHVDSAQAGLSSAQSQLKRARRNVKRGTIVAPFDAVVLDAPVEVGEVVSTITPLATLAAVDRYWVQVSIPVAELAFVDIPEVSTAGERGATAKIVHDAGAGIVIERTGYVERLLGAVEERGRMAQILVSIDDPLGAADAAARDLPLLIGSMVHVELAGRSMDGLVALPRRAVDPKGRVWIVADGALRSQTVDVVRRERTAVLVRGLDAGVVVVTTPLPVASDGMQVQVLDAEPAEPSVAQSAAAVEASSG